MRGFTLIELIIYIAIVAVILVLAVGFAWDVIYGETKSAVFREVQQNSRQALEKITRTIQAAADFVILNPSTLQLEIDDPNLNPTVFELSDDKIKITQGTNGPYDLTNKDVQVTNLVFTDLSYTGQPGTIRIEMTVEYSNPANRPEYEAILDLKSTASLRPLQIPVPETVILRPNQAGDETQLSQFPDTGANWDKIDEENSDDDSTYIYQTGSRLKNDLYHLPDPNISQNNIINQLTIYFRCKKAATAGIEGLAAAALKTNNQIDQQPLETLTDAYQLYSKIYPFNPITANSWTLEEINNLQIGFALSTTGGRFDQARCTQAWAEVKYRLSF